MVGVLVRAGLWVPAEGGGYHVHDYTVYNRTRAQIETQLAEDRKRKSSPDSGRNLAGTNPDSAWIPRAPGPGPGPGDELSPAGSARQPARAHETDPTLLADHLRRLEQERGSHGQPASHSKTSSRRRTKRAADVDG
jgi:hypothetical protein